MLEKNLPVASGIGGGSADAAAALRLLCRLWGVVTDRTLSRLALALGADVPVCLPGGRRGWRGSARCCAGAGIAGARYRAGQSGRRGLDTCCVPCPLGRIFLLGGVAAGGWPDAASLAATLRGNPQRPGTAGARLVPGYRRCARRHRGRCRDCLLARMSGSGATCFGLFGTRDGSQGGGQRVGAPRLVGVGRGGQSDMTLLASALPQLLTSVVGWRFTRGFADLSHGTRWGVAKR